MSSVKPFESKNRDKIDLDAPNPNLKINPDNSLKVRLLLKNLYQNLFSDLDS